MKRYYLAADGDMPTVEDYYGTFHFIDLASHGEAGDKWNLFCLVDDDIKPNENWIPFPPIYDSKTTLANSAIPHEKLVDIGLTGEETCIEAVMKLGEIHPLMGV